MTVVVDLGCSPHDGDVSIIPLIERFHPDTLYGFDPLLTTPEESFKLNGTAVHLARAAAWTNDGNLPLAVGAPSLLDATVVPDKNDRAEWSVTVPVPCFDFPDWLRALHEPAIVKLNIEGGEFPLLQAIRDSDADLLIVLLIVAWHDRRMGGRYPTWRKGLEESLRCPIEEWTL